MRILQISTTDQAGGAEAIALWLSQEYHRQNHNSWLGVGLKYTNYPHIIQIKQDQYSEILLQIAHFFDQWKGRIRGVHKIQNIFYKIARPITTIKNQLGHENFDFDGSWQLLNLLPQQPHLIHCHNLHGPFCPLGGYFDLRSLPFLSHKIPLVLTLHDAWLLSGHCAHSFDCDRWKTGCGKCPDLTIYPSIKRDATAYNWQRKQKIYANSKLYIATPSQWLMNKVKESILAPAIIESRVIPNGIDLSIFKPDNQKEIRTKLNLPLETKIILFTANGIRENPWKDYKTMQKAIGLVAENLPSQNILFLALGENGPPEKIGNATIQFIPYVKDPHAVADYYRVADVYVHAAKAETFGLVITEALACGTPVVATNVGGIPEQVEHGKTGFLTPVGDPLSMAEAIQHLLEDENLRHRMSKEAVKLAKEKFDVKRMANDYLDWYQTILKINNNHTFLPN